MEKINFDHLKNRLLFGEPTGVLGAWLPTEANRKRVGLKAGQRMLLYGCCQLCWENQPTTRIRAEEIILREASVQ